MKSRRVSRKLNDTQIPPIVQLGVPEPGIVQKLSGSGHTIEMSLLAATAGMLLLGSMTWGGEGRGN